MNNRIFLFPNQERTFLTLAKSTGGVMLARECLAKRMSRLRETFDGGS